MRHNLASGPPYHDNDFEFFVDVSGTTQYYKEFEKSARNATYDVLWGVPDGEDLHCAANASSPGGSYLPVCVNTSFPGYAGDWTMASAKPGLAGVGLTTATAYDAATYGKYTSPAGTWTAELAFPRIKMMTYFSPTTATRGSLRVLPGSNRSPLHGETMRRVRAQVQADVRNTDQGADIPGAVAFESQPGDAGKMATLSRFAALSVSLTRKAS